MSDGLSLLHIGLDGIAMIKLFNSCISFEVSAKCICMVILFTKNRNKTCSNRTYTEKGAVFFNFVYETIIFE